ncbi:MAG: hypothetical protein MUD02_02055 [Bacteroidales bacterium]|jgi:uncharacterized membrane-anchored protein YhcB (DUF1043 family)|nr:hypothetical protein [Bacteroidales bacterium]MCU0407708.1 hypothetical protein [Bacteroidales bacterium]
MAFISTTNRFNDFRSDFMKDTGFSNVEDNMDLYIQYVTARFADQNHKLLTNLAHDVQELQKAMKKV